LAKWSTGDGGEVVWPEEVSTEESRDVSEEEVASEESSGVSEEVEVSVGLGKEWRLMIDNAVDTLWQKAPTANLTVAWQQRQQSPPKKDSNVDRLIQFVAGQLFFDPHDLDALPIWYLTHHTHLRRVSHHPLTLTCGHRHRQRLHNLMLVISLAHEHGGNFSNFELVARGGDCPCDWTYCFGVVTCTTSHPDYPYLNPAYVQWFDVRDGPWTAADDRVSAYVSYARGLPWKERASVAVFRGTLNHMTTVQGLPGDPFLLRLNATNLYQYGRGKLMTLRQETGNSSQYLDVNMDAGPGETFAGLHVDQPHHLDLREQARRFKYAVVIEGSCGWADRLKWVLALGLVPILQVPSARILFHSLFPVKRRHC
jgi:hypothetical protein